MFGTMLTVSCTLMFAYVWWRVGGLAAARRWLDPRAATAVGVVLWSACCFALVAGHDGQRASAGALELVGMTWVGTVFLFTVCLLAVDLVTGFGLLLPSAAPRLRAAALVAGAGLALVALVQGHRTPVVSPFEVHPPGLPAELDGTVVVALSDLHLGAQLGPRWLEDRVAQVAAQRPDLVLLLGDLFEGHGPPSADLVPILGRLSAPLGVWAVTGNHEGHGGQGSAVGAMEAAGVQVLHDRWAVLAPGLVVAGVDGRNHEREGGALSSGVERALAGRPAGATVFLSHVPAEAELAAALGAGLMLAGHTHGGQLWPFDLAVRRVHPLLAGRYDVDGMTVIVGRGAGTWGPRMRLWRPGEILRIVLRTYRQASGVSRP